MASQLLQSSSTPPNADASPAAGHDLPPAVIRGSSLPQHPAQANRGKWRHVQLDWSFFLAPSQALHRDKKKRDPTTALHSFHLAAEFAALLLALLADPPLIPPPNHGKWQEPRGALRYNATHSLPVDKWEEITWFVDR